MQPVVCRMRMREKVHIPFPYCSSKCDVIEMAGPDAFADASLPLVDDIVGGFSVIGVLP